MARKLAAASRAGLMLVFMALTACAGGRPGGGPGPDAGLGPQPEPNAPARRAPALSDAAALYRRLGLLAEGGETPFVANLTFFGTRTTDSTTMLLTVALPNRSLRFSREGDRYRSAYQIGFEVKRGSDVVRTVTSDQTVRVLAFRETQRTDESVLFRRAMTLAPGLYDVRLSVRGDSVPNGSAIEASIGVPRLGEGTISSPVAFYEATARVARDSAVRVLPTPRATVIFGRDSVLPFYVEGYPRSNAAPVSVAVAVSPEGAPGALWSDTLELAAQRDLSAGIIQVPVNRLGVGVMQVAVTRIGGTDTLRAPLFVAFGEELPVATFAEMMDYLRYYVSASRLAAMRQAPPAERAALWAAFLRDSDPVPQTPAHEGLRDYFGRIARANAQFREEGGAGWLTDRGRVFVALGPPDQILEPNINDLSRRNRAQIWEYREHRLQVVFIDQSGFGRWRMNLSSENEFEATARRVLVQ